MKNKLYALLILIVMFGGLFVFIGYFYIYYTGTLTIQSNVDGYNIKLHSNSIKKNYKFSCNKKICSYEDIPPVNFYYVATKEGYNGVAGFIDINSNINNDLKIFFKEKISIKDVKISKKEKIKAIIDKKRLTKKEKIKAIIEKKKLESFFKYYDFGEKGIFYIKEESNSLDLFNFNNNKKLYSFSKVKKDKILLFDVLGDNTILINVDGNIYIYNLFLGKVNKFKLALPINYVKYSVSKKEYIINTTKGSFIYNKKYNKLKYFYLFEDFVYLKGNIIGIISDYDIKRQDNYGIKVVGKKSIVFYDSLTKSKDKIIDINYNLKQIYNYNNIIYLIDDNNKKKILENIDKYYK